MIKFLSILILISCTTSQSTTKQTPKTQFENQQNEQKKEIKPIQSIMKNCVCAQIWLPVCGVNGKTYSNACFADCAGVKYHQGTCTEVIKD